MIPYTITVSFVFREEGCGNSDSEFQSAEDILDNVLASAGCKEYFNSESNFLETHFDLLQEQVTTESPSSSFFRPSSTIYPQVSTVKYISTFSYFPRSEFTTSVANWCVQRTYRVKKVLSSSPISIVDTPKFRKF